MVMVIFPLPKQRQREGKGGQAAEEVRLETTAVTRWEKLADEKPVVPLE